MPELEPNAFTINRLGLGGLFFPLSLKVTRADGNTQAFMCAQRLIDCAGLIAARSAGHLAVFGLDHYSILDDATGKPLPLAALARQAGVSSTSIDEDTSVIPADQLTMLLAGFSHDNLTLFDLPPEWDENTVIRGVLAYKEHDWKADAPLLTGLPGSRFLIDSHDDCYLTVESADTLLPRQIFARMLGLYAAAVLEQADIAAVPEGLVDTIWQEEFGLTILRYLTEVTSSGLCIGVTRKSFTFSNGETYPLDFRLTYDVNDRKWERED
jgi:hypothetical protein